MSADSITVTEERVDELLETMPLAAPDRCGVQTWYEQHRRSSRALPLSHRPFKGVLEVIRWFQLQPMTAIGLNTGRPESMRDVTLQALNRLGREYRVCFSDELLWMASGETEAHVLCSKAAALDHFRSLGYVVVAALDNEPKYLEAMARADRSGEVLLLHADTVFSSRRAQLPSHSVRGDDYSLSDILSERHLPHHTRLVRQGLDTVDALERFLASNVHWGELAVRQDLVSGRLVIRPLSFTTAPLVREEAPLFLADVLCPMGAAGKGVKLDLREGVRLVDRVIAEIGEARLAREDVWCGGRLEDLRESGFRRLSSSGIAAHLDLSVDFLAPLVLGSPDTARSLLSGFEEWGVDHVSLGWSTGNKTAVLDRLTAWGYETTLCDVPDLEAFLRAVLLSPFSIASGFSFSASPATPASSYLPMPALSL